MTRAGVTVDRVISTAADVADEEGMSAITMSAVAQRLGISVPGLYKHVDGLAGVSRLLTVRSTDELADVMSLAIMGQSRDDALRMLCSAYRDYGKRHPGRYAATVAAPVVGDEDHQRATSRALAPVLALLASYGLAESDAVDAARFLRSVLHGFVTLEIAGGFGLPQDVDASFGQAVEAVGLALRSWASIERPLASA